MKRDMYMTTGNDRKYLLNKNNRATDHLYCDIVILEEEVYRSGAVIWRTPQNDRQAQVNVRHHKTFDNATTKDQLRTASWNNNSNPTGVVNLRYKGSFTASKNKMQCKENKYYRREYSHTSTMKNLVQTFSEASPSALGSELATK